MRVTFPKWMIFIRNITLLLCLSNLQAQNSVLSKGNWFKIGIIDNGIYVLDYNFFQSQLGISPMDIDPFTIKIYGNGGTPLSQYISAKDLLTLQQNPTLGVGMEDGSFDSEDYFLFYGQGPVGITMNEDSYDYYNNIYSDTSYYFITYGGAIGSRIEEKEKSANDGQVITKFKDLITYEKNSKNIIKVGVSRGGSGREWYGDPLEINNINKSLSFPAKNFLGTGVLNITILSESYGPSYVDLSINGQLLGTQELPSIANALDYPYADKGALHTLQLPININSSNSIDFDLDFRRYPDGISRIRIDKIILEADRDLILSESQMIFNSMQLTSTPVSTYQIISDHPVNVWDISNPLHPSSMSVGQTGNKYSFSDSSHIFKQYIAWKDNDFMLPTFFKRIANQNLQGMSPGNGLIITNATLMDQAVRLADFHKEKNGLDIGVVKVQEIYDEYGSGKQDISAIRNFIRSCWLKSPNFENVLLFGDCSYDFFEMGTSMFIPAYQSRNSLNPVTSHSSDDFYGFLEEGEGEWIESKEGDHTLDIGIGRIPVNDIEQAKGVVDKIIRYSTSERTLGNWKNKVTYLVDDADNNNHVRDAERLVPLLESSYVVPEKLYLDAFPQQNNTSQGTSPVVHDLLMRNFEDGTFLINFMGHGREDQWMHENIFNNSMINDLTNRFKLPLIITATCEYGRYDDPDFFSGSEQLLLNPNRGAIALLTTTRPVTASANFMLNEAFHNIVFTNTGNDRPRLGDIIRSTKNGSLLGVSNRNFALLGDPFLQLQYPEYRVKLTSVNDNDIFLEADTLSALENIEISGQIVDLNGNPITTFQGYTEIELYDSKDIATTLGDENTPSISFKRQENVVFRGKASVIDGVFNCTFTLSKHISYQYDPGKFSFYAVDTVNRTDASGFCNDILMGGTNDDAPLDATAPQISLYIDDGSFRDGQVVETGSNLIAKIEEDTGINISESAIAQKITLQLNGDTVLTLNDYYSSELDDSSNGRIVYPLAQLSPGEYTAELILWDLHGNKANVVLHFTLVESTGLGVEKLIIYPNPVYDGNALITFEHLRLGEDLDINIILIDSKGKLIHGFHYMMKDSDNRLEIPIKIPESVLPGIYFCKIVIKSLVDGGEEQRIKRLIIK